MDPLLFGVVLAGALVSSEHSENSREAAVYSLRAGYYQGGYDKIIDPIAKEWDKKYIPDGLRKFGVGASFIYRLAEDKRVEYIWSF
jgi:hypothetical protein